MKRKAIFFFVAIMIPSWTWSQSLGIESGIAGIENYDFQSNLSLSVLFTLQEKIYGNIIYVMWRGSDENYNMAVQQKDSWTNSTYFGSRGLQFVLLFNLVSDEKFSFFGGMGTGWYQKFWLDLSHNKQQYQQGSYTGVILVSYEITRNLSLMTRGMLSLERVIGVPQWGFLNLGIMYELW